MRDHGLQESHVSVVERWLGAGGWGVGVGSPQAASRTTATTASKLFRIVSFS
jgi:hypothetical protein